MRREPSRPTPAVFRLKADGSQSCEPVARFDTAANQIVAKPSDPGAIDDQVFLLVYGAGVRGRRALGAVRVAAGGVPCEVSDAWPQGDFVDLNRVTARLPRDLAGRGLVNGALTADRSAANGVSINIK